MARHRGRLLREHDLQPSRFERVLLELTVVEVFSVRLYDPAMTERVPPAGIEGEPGFAVFLEAPRQVEQTSVMVHVTVADDQGIGLGRVNSQSLVVVCEGVRREREVQQDLLFLGSPEGLQMIGQPMLREQRDVRAVGEGQVISFDVDVAKFSAFREDIIDVVDQVGHDQPVYRWDFLGRGQEAAKATCATQQDRSACDCSELQDFTPVHDWPPSSISAYVEPWRDPDIFNVEHQAQHHLDWQRNHGEKKDHQDGVLQQALALIIFGVVAAIQRVHQKAADGEEAADYRGTEDGFAEVGGDAEKIRQVAIDLVDQAVVIPGLPGPEPLPPWTANEGADGDHRYPENDEAEEERADFKFALLPG